MPDSDTNIAALAAEVRAFCEARDWDPFHGPKDLAIGIATEAAELLEIFRFATADDEARLTSAPTTAPRSRRNSPISRFSSSASPSASTSI